MGAVKTQTTYLRGLDFEQVWAALYGKSGAVERN